MTIAIRDIDKSNNTTDEVIVAIHWVRPVLRVKRLAVGTEHNLIIDVRAHTLMKCLIYFALLNRVWLAVCPRVMHQLVHVLADYVVDRVKPEQPRARWVGKGAMAFEINSVDSLARRIQQKLSEFAAIDDLARCLL